MNRQNVFYVYDVKRFDTGIQSKFQESSLTGEFFISCRNSESAASACCLISWLESLSILNKPAGIVIESCWTVNRSNALGEKGGITIEKIRKETKHVNIRNTVQHCYPTHQKLSHIRVQHIHALSQERYEFFNAKEQKQDKGKSEINTSIMISI